MAQAGSPVPSEGRTGTAQSPADSEEQTREELPKSRVFELLSAERRQEVLRYLDETGDTNVGDVAEHVAAEECDCSVRQLSSQQRKRVYVGLYQCHLPKLADAGVIDYDRDRGTVALTERADRLLAHLYFEENHEAESRLKLLLDWLC